MPIVRTLAIGAEDPDSGSNRAHDGVRYPEDLADDVTCQEFVEYLRSLDEQEQVSLIALAWLGRGTYEASDGPRR